MIAHVRLVKYFGTPLAFGCDGKCKKAWGLNSRPKVMLGADIGGDIDDFVYKADCDIGTAPQDPGTYEGADLEAKPLPHEEKLNRWCLRECERSTSCDMGELLVLPDWDNPTPNFGSRHEEWEAMHPLCADCGHLLRHHNSHGHDSGGCTLGNCPCMDFS